MVVLAVQEREDILGVHRREASHLPVAAILAEATERLLAMGPHQEAATRLLDRLYPQAWAVATTVGTVAAGACLVPKVDSVALTMEAVDIMDSLEATQEVSAAWEEDQVGDTVALKVATGALVLAAPAKLDTTVVWAEREVLAGEVTMEDLVAAARVAMEELEAWEVVMEPEELEAMVMVSEPEVITAAIQAEHFLVVPVATLSAEVVDTLVAVDTDPEAAREVLEEVTMVAAAASEVAATGVQRADMAAEVMEVLRAATVEEVTGVLKGDTGDFFEPRFPL